MADEHHAHTPPELSEQVGEKEARKLRARSNPNSVWFGLGLFGVIGWSIAIPMLIGIFIGAWLDAELPGSFSWTLTLLVVGVVLGCINAWQWIDREQQMIEEDERNDIE